jgi:hypothetical protein
MLALLNKISKVFQTNTELALDEAELRIMAHMSQDYINQRSQLTSDAPEFCAWTSRLSKALKDNTGFVLTKKDISVWYTLVRTWGDMSQSEMKTIFTKNGEQGEEVSPQNRGSESVFNDLSDPQSFQRNGCSS